MYNSIHLLIKMGLNVENGLFVELLKGCGIWFLNSGMNDRHQLDSTEIRHYQFENGKRQNLSLLLGHMLGCTDSAMKRKLTSQTLSSSSADFLRFDLLGRMSATLSLCINIWWVWSALRSSSWVCVSLSLASLTAELAGVADVASLLLTTELAEFHVGVVTADWLVRV